MDNAGASTFTLAAVAECGERHSLVADARAAQLIAHFGPFTTSANERRFAGYRYWGNRFKYRLRNSHVSIQIMVFRSPMNI